MSIENFLKNDESILITGGTGFVGSNLANKLLRNKVRVHIVARENSDLSSLDLKNEFLEVHIFDERYETLENILKKAKPKIVFHLASLFIAEHESEDIKKIIESNITFGTMLSEAMAKNEIKLLINTGTSWEHEDSDLYKPVNLYAASKKAFNDIIYYFHNAKNFSCITLKLFDTYGYNDKRNKLLSLLQQYAISGKELKMSEGEQLLDLVFIDDVIEAFICAAIKLIESNSNLFEEYAISSGEFISLKNLCFLVSDTLQKKLNVVFGARPYREREVMNPWRPGNILPDWKPENDMQTSIKNFLLDE